MEFINDINLNMYAPKYLQITYYFIHKIDNGEIGEGEQLPTEKAIGDMFNVSRITVGKALNELVNQGYIIKKQGKGSFVSLEKKRMQLNAIKGFSEEMKSKGLVPSTKLISINVIEPRIEIAKKLELDINVKVYCIERIRCADGIRMAIEKVFIPFYLIPDIDKCNLEGSLYEILRERYGIVITKGTQSIEAGLIDSEVAELLNIEPESVGLIIERVSYIDNKPFEYVKSIYRGDKYKFVVELNS
ncbi:phosphonate metabolism transcriptional regulator PhnF [Vallitalea sp. AN17-2]|uniref:Phosphonate metabolism transcriptional regulator PhnF n=1 Tax=Vallitalea maricola TaxID=3074433 RepID=A0ACB5UIE2_9FIRM|nr:phosphonate metabolism transcriptional regulator PhnF [Vallitalea sp. AN17-2]